MNKLLPLLLALALIACTSPGTKETPAQDSTADNDTLPVLVPEEHAAPKAEVITGDTSLLADRFEEVSSANTFASEHWYTVSITTDQYEASSDVTWYFDETIAPRYFKMTWSAEGNEGITELFIENNTVVCAQEVEGDWAETWCSTTGGTQATFGENDRIVKTLLAPGYGKNCNENFERYLNTLKSLLKDGKISEQDENFYTIRLEITVNYGQEYTETTEVKIGKNVYEALTGN